MTRIPESDSHRYAGARPPDRRRTCPEVVAAIVVAAAAVAAPIVDDAVADSAISAVTPATTAAALLGSARANIAVQRYILGSACGIGIGAGRRQKTHDFYPLYPSAIEPRRPLPCDESRARRDVRLPILVPSHLILRRRCTRNDREQIHFRLLSPIEQGSDILFALSTTQTLERERELTRIKLLDFFFLNLFIINKKN